MCVCVRVWVCVCECVCVCGWVGVCARAFVYTSVWAKYHHTFVPRVGFVKPEAYGSVYSQARKHTRTRMLVCVYAPSQLYAAS